MTNLHRQISRKKYKRINLPFLNRFDYVIRLHICLLPVLYAEQKSLVSKREDGNNNGLQENLQAVSVPEAGLEPAHF